ncbi:hypothetical protein ACS0TY_024506 [Phlomoides rotata]
MRKGEEEYDNLRFIFTAIPEPPAKIDEMVEVANYPVTTKVSECLQAPSHVEKFMHTLTLMCMIMVEYEIPFPLAMPTFFRSEFHCIIFSV